jgi:hypothetical protein
LVTSPASKARSLIVTWPSDFKNIRYQPFTKRPIAEQRRAAEISITCILQVIAVSLCLASYKIGWDGE